MIIDQIIWKKINIKIESAKKEKKNKKQMEAQPSFETYNKLKLLGEGAFGKAFLVECNSDKSLAVIK